MKSMKKQLVFLAVSVSVVGALGAIYISREAVQLPVAEKTVQLSVGSSTVRAFIAETPQEKKKGLSGRPALGDTEGMFFRFDSPDLYSFWMKDMLMPIDIIWIDSDYSVADITPDVRPESYPNLFYPKVPVQYVLEVQAGWANAHDVKIGDRVGSY